MTQTHYARSRVCECFSILFAACLICQQIADYAPRTTWTSSAGVDSRICCQRQAVPTPSSTPFKIRCRPRTSRFLRPGSTWFPSAPNTTPHEDVFSSVATHEIAVSHTSSIKTLPQPIMPWQDLRWLIIANARAKSASHVDTLHTVMMLLLGHKIVAVAVRRDGLAEQGDLRGDFSSRHAYDDWHSGQSNKDFHRWEFFWLTPDMAL